VRAWLLVLVAACSGHDECPELAPSIGDVCEDIGAAACARAAACGIDATGCEAAFVASCCGSSCNYLTSWLEADAVAACVAAYPAWPCADIATAAPPACKELEP
jgi:hypothetical protein